MDKSRIIAVAVCISLLGFTLTPQALLPCCCSREGKVAEAVESAPCCRMERPVESCCRAAAEGQACPAERAFGLKCAHCLCPAHLQNTAIPGFKAHQITNWVPVVVAASTSVHRPSGPETQRGLICVNALLPISTILLDTCVLLS